MVEMLVVAKAVLKVDCLAGQRADGWVELTAEH
jgi:hypothetical protein